MFLSTCPQNVKTSRNSLPSVPSREIEVIMKGLWVDMDHEKELMLYTELLPNHKEPGRRS